MTQVAGSLRFDYENLIGAEHPARAIWRLLEALEFEPLAVKIHNL